MYCEICGREPKIIPGGFLSYNTVHNCITGTSVICIHDYNHECVYCGLPSELETPEGMQIVDYCKKFVYKEIRAKNQYLMHALRTSTMNNLRKNIDKMAPINVKDIYNSTITESDTDTSSDSEYNSGSDSEYNSNSDFEFISMSDVE